MMDQLLNLLQTIEQTVRLIEIWDVIDVAIVAYVIYRLLLFIRRSRSGQVAKAVLILFLHWQSPMWSICGSSTIS